MTAQEMWDRSGFQGNYQAWAFGGAPDKLAKLVMQGVKTATCSALALYEYENEEIPKVGDYSVILDSDGQAVCIIRTTKIYIETFDQVSERHAYLEGEGDRSLEYWRQVHEEFFTEELKTIQQNFDAKMELVCEKFEVVFAEMV